jgi:riboflavin kinase/FMN adenylyltransferase
VEFYTALSEIPRDFGPSAVTIGKFDGLHRGHRSVFAALTAAASEQRLVSTVLTFDRNPLSLIAPARCPRALVSNAQKRELLAETGVDATVMLTFDRAFSQLTPQQFAQRVLRDALHARLVLVGPDFRFGARNAGDVPCLAELGARHGFRVDTVEVTTSDGTRRVSASRIRQALEEGDITGAAGLLGRAPRLRGTVVRGQQRGRALGFPTANLSANSEGFIPADGIYAGWLSVAGRSLPAAISIGNNPTFRGVPERQVEAHVLRASAPDIAVLGAGLDLYDKTVEVSFAERIRGMERFERVDDLVARMREDAAEAKRILGVP